MSSLARIVLAGGAIGLGAAALSPATAYAHGFGERYDLPVPLWLYVTGAGAAVALSFVVIGLFMRGDRGGRAYPRVNLLKWLPFRLLSHPIALFPLQLAAVALFLLVVVGGLVGEQEPTDNAAPVLVWILWWVGLAYVSALLGNVWAILNPWKIIFTWVEWAFVTATDGKELNLGYRYPVRFGVWPAFILFWAFAWIELVYVDAAVPAHLARLAINYSIITWAGMLIYGKDQWLRHGETFTLVFGFLAKFAPTEVRTLDDSTCRACPLDCLDEDGLCIDCHRCFSRVPRRQKGTQSSTFRRRSFTKRSRFHFDGGSRRAPALDGYLRRSCGHPPVGFHSRRTRQRHLPAAVTSWVRWGFWCSRCSSARFTSSRHGS